MNVTISVAPGRRERKKAATRRTIKRAAVQIALEQGLDNLTVEAISEAADISARTFFNYFSSKEDALMPEAPWTAAEVVELIRQRPANEPILQAMREVTKQLGLASVQRQEEETQWHELFRRYPELVSRMFGQRQSIAESFATVVRAVAERLGVNPGSSLYPIMLVTTAIATLQAAVGFWTAVEHSSSPQRLAELIDEGFDLLEKGL